MQSARKSTCHPDDNIDDFLGFVEIPVKVILSIKYLTAGILYGRIYKCFSLKGSDNFGNHASELRVLNAQSC